MNLHPFVIEALVEEKIQRLRSEGARNQELCREGILQKIDFRIRTWFTHSIYHFRFPFLNHRHPEARPSRPEQSFMEKPSLQVSSNTGFTINFYSDKSDFKNRK